MSLIRCEKCNHIDNTALCRYWITRDNDEDILCSECDPIIHKWHNLFDREKYNPKIHQVKNP